ncbi:hypothetical protein EV363DRAFT_1267602 [Boletus edulis]|nr:hypothetical protein EV363DRAFT_1267602 [Boletus edulis]
MNKDSSTTHAVQHSKPIPISTQHIRHRSASFSSDSTSPASSPPLVTPNNIINTRIPVPSSSPILHFLSQSSPTKSPATFPFRGFVPPPPAEERTLPLRRASTASRFQPQPPVLEPLHERGVNVLRRLSLSVFIDNTSTSSHVLQPFVTDIPQPTNPQPPPDSTLPGLPPTMHKRKFRRSATVVERPRRAPSPMGERILKGHFDGFN